MGFKVGDCVLKDNVVEITKINAIFNFYWVSFRNDRYLWRDWVNEHNLKLAPSEFQLKSKLGHSYVNGPNICEKSDD